MQIPTAIRLMRETRVLRHFSFKTENTYIYWLGRYGAFLRDQHLTASTKDQNIQPESQRGFNPRAQGWPGHSVV